MPWGTDITSGIAGGQLQGPASMPAIAAFPSAMQSSLDNLAAGLISAVNQQQKAGYDAGVQLCTQSELDFFTPFTTIRAQVRMRWRRSATMTVALTNPDQVAASSDGTQGDNGNATALADLQNATIVSSQTAGDYYSNLIDQVGNSVSNATSEPGSYRPESCSGAAHQPAVVHFGCFAR